MEHENDSLPLSEETEALVTRARTVALNVYTIAGHVVQTRLEDAPATGRPS
ncbi:hypothetical protein AA0616_2597 [Komagataeibacter nataicola NRIC 0616]|nr:hypothetical protein AA0616_2597 [Komagataeibacter nataicola NRIC 0616]